MICKDILLITLLKEPVIFLAHIHMVLSIAI